MTPEEKMASVHAQVRSIQRGESNAIVCPYCGMINQKGETLCCEILLKAAAAALQRVILDNTVEHVERVMEKVARN